jgi:S1-C subfamily serine protease
VVGIATAVISGAQGLCFAVAANTANFVMTELLAHGHVRRGSIGVVAQQTPVPPAMARATGVTQGYAVWVAAIEAQGPAAKSGLAEGDLIISADGAPLTGLDDLLRVLGPGSIDRQIAFEVIRAGKRLLSLPAATSAAAVLQAESDEQIKLMGSPNQVEAVAAALQKRAPEFRDSI